MFEIKKLPVGMAQSNCYILSNGTNALIVDPGDQAQLIINTINDLNVKPHAT